MQQDQMTPRASAVTDDGAVEAQALSHEFNEGVAAFQISANGVAVHRQGSSLVLQTAPGIRGMAVDSRHVVIWTNNEIQVFRVDDSGVEMHADFASNPASVALYRESLFVAQKHELLVTDLSGIQRLSMRFPDEPALLDVASNFLALATSGGMIQVMDTSRKEPTLTHAPGKFVDPASGELIGPIESIKCNASGSLVAVAVEGEIFAYNAKSGQVKKLDVVPPKNFPTFYSWDPAEAQLMVCGFQQLDGGPGVAVLFVSENGDVHVHERFMVDPLTFPLAIDTPRLYFAQCGVAGEGGVPTALISRQMRNFDNLQDDVSPSTLSAIVQFSHYLALGDVEKAYIAVAGIKTSSVWENLCRVCVKSNNRDLAQRCLSNMGNDAQGVVAERAIESEPEDEVALAKIAIQLGLIDDAARLYRECKRHDLLNDLLQAQGRWDEALDVARDYDQINLRSTHLRFAMHLDSIGREQAALRHMEESGVYSKPLLRKLIDANRHSDAENCVSKSRDSSLMQWLAAHFESSGNFDKAREWYQMAGDDVSLVRMALHEDDLEAALSVLNERNHAAASYQIGRHLEGTGRIREAVSLYERSGFHNHAIRLSKSHGLRKELMALALKSNSAPQVIESALYFEQKGDVGKAAQLYAKGGHRSKALDLCAGSDGTNGDLTKVLSVLVESVDDASDLSDVNIERYATQLIDAGHGEKVVTLLCRRNGDLSSEMISLCDTHQIIVTDSLRRELSPKPDVERAERMAILKKLATLCEKQGSHQLASKVYTKGGDRISAMRCLLEQGENALIVAYAKAAKTKETYIMAANHLISTNAWHNDPSLAETIVLLLLKAKSYEGLVRFYASWSQSEIDEHKDYEKALEALTEACKYSKKVRDEKVGTDLCRNLERQTNSIKRFLRAKEGLMQSDLSAMQALCTSLLEKSISNRRNNSVRAEHCVALLVQYYFKEKKFQEAYDAMQSIIHPEVHIDIDIIEAVYRALGKDWHEDLHDVEDDEFSDFD